MPAATSADAIVALLGEIEPIVVERLLASGATLSEIAVAANAIEHEDEIGGIHDAVLSPRETEVRSILEDYLLDDSEDREEALARRS